MPNYSRDLTERQQLSAAAQDVSLKRTRRTEEPTYKAADDAALDAPWRDLEGISQPVLFALSEVFHFSHTTEVQRVAVPRLIKDGQHGVIEAPTGSGKTLSFLVPLLERQLRHTAAFFKAHKRPLLTRRIVGCVLSPSRVLAQQTYVVARSLGCRSLQEVRFELCDTVVTKVGGIVAHLRKVARNGGVVLVGTPADFETVWRALDGEAAVGDSSDDEEPEEVPVVEEEEEDAAQRKAALAARRRRDEGRSHGPQPGTSSEAEPCRVVANDGHPFAFVVDEADVVLKSPKMRNSIHRLIDRYRAAHGEEAPLDMVLCGATVGSAPEVPRLLQHARVPPARLARVVVGTTEHFIQQLDNRYIVTSSEDMLGMLVHLINTHPTKKHLIFFNSASVLCYVRAALEGLTDHKRPLLHIPALFSLHEQQRDSVKFREFGRFVKYSAKDAAAAMVRKFQQAQRHGTCLTASGTAAPAALGATQHRRKGTVNTEATIVAKGKQQAVPGAVLLCTDVAAFGLDIRDVDYVYHFEVPATTRAYVHRIGRVARMGMRGSSVILVPALEEGGASAVQQAYLKELTEAHSLNACACPSMAATITPAIRNSVQRDPKLAGLLGEAAQDMAAKAPWLSPAEAAAFLCGVAA